MLGKQILAVTICVTFLAAPVAGGGSVVGVTSDAKLVRLQGMKALPGSSIFSGDVVEVSKGGSGTFTLNDRSLLALGPESSARVLNGKEGLRVEALTGRIAFHVPQGGNLAAVLADATIRNAGTKAAVGLIQFRGPKSAVVAAEKGALSITSAHDGKTVTLSEGEGVEVALAPAPPASPAPPPPVAALTGPQIAIIGVAMAAITIGVGAALSSAEPNVSLEQLRAIVSPIRP